MDDQEERDYHNFSTSPTHKLPTLNGTQAFRLATKQSRPYSTGLRSLDNSLYRIEGEVRGGIRRGVVTEIYGPPGVGKTTFALEIAINAISESEDENHVVWLDTASSLTTTRLNELAAKHLVLAERDATNGQSLINDSVLRNQFHRIRIDRLPQLLALLLHPPADFPPKGTGLIVLDDISSFLLSELAQTSKRTSATSLDTNAQIKSDYAAKIAITRRSNVINGFVSGVQKLAAATNAAVLLVNKTSSVTKNGQKALLRSALNSEQWVNHINTRILLYRDRWPKLDYSELEVDDAKKEKRKQCFPPRVAEIERLEGKEVSSEGVQFIIIQVWAWKQVSECFTDFMSQNGLQAINESEKFPHHLQVREEDPDFATSKDDDNVVSLPSEDEAEEDMLASLPGEKAGCGPPANTRQQSKDQDRALKRKAFEIADSEEEDLADDEEITLPSIPQKFTGFLPSSQLTHGEIPHNVHQSIATDRPTEINQHNEDDEDMLLNAYEGD